MIDWQRDRGFIGVASVAIAVVGAMVTFVVAGVSREEPPTFAPTPADPALATGGSPESGPRLFTIDATTPDVWRFFSFETGTLVERPGPIDWDLAFRRFQVIANGGQGFAGIGGILDLGDISFDSLTTVPATGYVLNTVRSDTVNAAAADWYDYSMLSHLLQPHPRVYAVRSALGRYAKLEFVAYYCPGAQPGCVTFRYVYQPDGGLDVGAGQLFQPSNISSR